jgi:hypothetical protein
VLVSAGRTPAGLLAPLRHQETTPGSDGHYKRKPGQFVCCVLVSAMCGKHHNFDDTLREHRPFFRANDRLIGQPPNPSAISHQLDLASDSSAPACCTMATAPEPDYTRNSPPPLSHCAASFCIVNSKAPGGHRNKQQGNPPLCTGLGVCSPPQSSLDMQLCVHFHLLHSAAAFPFTSLLSNSANCYACQQGQPIVDHCGPTCGVTVWAGWGVCSPPPLSHLQAGHLPKAGS